MPSWQVQRLLLDTVTHMLQRITTRAIRFLLPTPLPHARSLARYLARSRACAVSRPLHVCARACARIRNKTQDGSAERSLGQTKLQDHAVRSGRGLCRGRGLKREGGAGSLSECRNRLHKSCLASPRPVNQREGKVEGVLGAGYVERWVERDQCQRRVWSACGCVEHPSWSRPEDHRVEPPS